MRNAKVNQQTRMRRFLRMTEIRVLRKVCYAPLHAPHFYPILLNEPKALHRIRRQHGQPPCTARHSVERNSDGLSLCTGAFKPVELRLGHGARHPGLLNQVISVSMPEAIEPLFVLDALLSIEQKLAGTALPRPRVPIAFHRPRPARSRRGAHGNGGLDPPHPRIPAVCWRRWRIGARLHRPGGPTVAELLRTCTDESAVQRLETTREIPLRIHRY